MEIRKRYIIYYDDGTEDGVRKEGVVEWIKDGMFKLDSKPEELVIAKVNRAVPVNESGFGGANSKG